MNNVFLFHGTNQDISAPRCDVGSSARDFGKCFYTTYSWRMAKRWAEMNFPSHPVVNKYSLDLEKLSDGNLKIKHFVADADWARFVYENRNNPKFKRPDYDIIIGPIADNNLKKHFMKIKTERLTFEEIAPMINFRRYTSLQVCFCSEYAISILNKLI